MCGICGYRSSKSVNLENMVHIMAHRGPDDRGFFRSNGVGLGHRRLSIIDLVTGTQPMYSDDKHVVIVFNGEIYNFLELKKNLIQKGDTFHTTSDTEVLLNMYLRYGKDMLKYLNGMFAFVLYDRRNDILFGARDRLGIKPLYYTYNENGFFFASEIKALFASACVKPKGNPVAADLYFTYRYIPDKHTAYKDIFKVLPAHAFEQTGQKPPRFWRYWDFPEEQTQSDVNAAVETFDDMLTKSVQYRLISDVPLGVFLSGGVDSTTIISLMAKLNHHPIRAFTVGFNTAVDEIADAQKTSQHFQCEHDITYVYAESFDLLRKIIWHMDEPFGDPILIPTYLLSQNAAQKVKVVLTGEGADEGLMGYIHQENLASGLFWGSKISPFLLNLCGKWIQHVPVGVLDHAFNYPASMGTAGRQRLGQFLPALCNPGQAYELFVSLFTEQERENLFGPTLKAGKEQARIEYHQPVAEKINQAPDPLRAIYLHDFTHWLPDNILNKQDRMTMANSLEGRVPFLDHHLVEFEARLPLHFKIRNHKGKFLLKELFYARYASYRQQAQKKRAFYMSLEGQYQRQYKQCIQHYLHPSNIDDRLFDPAEVQKLIEDADNSPLIGHKKVMALLAFHIWADIFQPEW